MCLAVAATGSGNSEPDLVTESRTSQAKILVSEQRFIYAAMENCGSAVIVVIGFFS